jgi:hypothetical protein
VFAFAPAGMTGGVGVLAVGLGEGDSVGRARGFGAPPQPTRQQERATAAMNVVMLGICWSLAAYFPRW